MDRRNLESCDRLAVVSADAKRSSPPEPRRASGGPANIFQKYSPLRAVAPAGLDGATSMAPGCAHTVTVAFVAESTHDGRADTRSNRFRLIALGRVTRRVCARGRWNAIPFRRRRRQSRVSAGGRGGAHGAVSVESNRDTCGAWARHEYATPCTPLLTTRAGSGR